MDIIRQNVQLITTHYNARRVPTYIGPLVDSTFEGGYVENCQPGLTDDEPVRHAVSPLHAQVARARQISRKICRSELG
jgi:hypothetical protein